MAKAVRKMKEELRQFKPYQEYKDSGIEWLGEIPAHWETKRLRFLSNINPSSSELKNSSPDLEISFVPMDAVEEWGGLNLDSTKQLNEVSSGYTFFRDGDVLVAKITPCFENGKGAVVKGLTNETGFGTTELHVIRPASTLTAAFLAYLTFSHPFRGLGQSEMKGVAGQQRVPENFIQDFVVPLPSVSEQNALAAFLDRETAKIDALVNRKERLIELLKEKRTALITHAVTKGLDPNVPTKDSGIEWLGEIPAHWEFGRLKMLVSLSSEKNGNRPVGEMLSVSGYRGVELKDYDYKEQKRTTEELADYRVVRKGQLVVNTMWLNYSGLGVSDLEGYVSPAYRCYWIHDRYERGYLHHLVRSDVYVGRYCALLYGIRPNSFQIKPNDWDSIELLVPPRSEQRGIVVFLDRETAKIDALVEKINEAIDRLKEYRTSLISAAVTGKIDVREEVA